MQVKKFEASSVVEALKQVKGDLGPDAIILSTQEAKKTLGGGRKFVVVAAVSEHQLKKKELAQQQLGAVYKDRVQDQSANKQKMFIENVYRGAEKKYEARHKTLTRTQYIDIDDSPQAEAPGASVVPSMERPVKVGASSLERVKMAAQEAFKTSVGSEFFAKSPVEDQDEALLDDEILRSVVRGPEHKPQVSGPVANMIQRLKSCGVSLELCDSLVFQCSRELGRGTERRALVDSWFAKWILNQVTVAQEGTSKAVEVFVGPHGSGKTTSLVKLATHYVVQENKRVAIVTSDLNKVGGVEQLRVYSRILNAPIYVVKDPADIAVTVARLTEFDKILVDTPGISLSNIEELDFMRAVAQLTPEGGSTVHLVISALTKEKDLGGILKRFRVSQFDDVVVSNIDQTSQHGILINIQKIINKPFHSFGIGSDIVDGFEVASRERVLDLVFKLTKHSGDRGNDSSI